jgi:hypothetical protein
MSKRVRKQGPTNVTVSQQAPRQLKGPPPLPKGPPPLPKGPATRKGPPPLPTSCPPLPCTCLSDRCLEFDALEIAFFRRGEALSREHIHQAHALTREIKQAAKAKALRRNASRGAAGSVFAAAVALAVVSVGRPAWELVKGSLEPSALAQVSPAPRPPISVAHADPPRTPRAAEARPAPPAHRDTRHRNRSNTASRPKTR